MISLPMSMPMLPTLLLWQWLLACLGCVLAGLLVHGLLQLAARTWPALRGQRSVWLAAQAVVASVALLPFLPLPDQLAMAPALTLQIGAPLRSPMPMPVPTPLSPAVQRTGAVPAAVVTSTRVGANTETAATVLARAPLLAYAPLLWAVIYLAGLLSAVLRLARAGHLWRGLLAGSWRLSRQALGAHGGFDARQLYDICRHRLTVMETAAALSPMLVGAWRPVLLLPRHLRDFPVDQQRLIIAHELAHYRARDPVLLALSALVQTLLWFNPAARWLGVRLAWAVELACDRRVLAGRPREQRKQYATALLAQWRAQLVAQPAAAVAFGATDADMVGKRIEQLRHAKPAPLPAAGVCTVAAVLIGVLAGGTVLRPALAGSAPAAATATADPMVTRTAVATTASIATTAATATTATTAGARPVAWQYPLDKMRVAGFFGIMRSVSPRPNPGLDLAAPVGTPVRAAAAGTVVAAGPLNQNNGRYGTAIIITSGSGDGATEALYAHLDRMTVTPGTKVVAGQVIGSIGMTGFTTGPHLHFQLRQNGRAIDPATVLAGLDQYATRRALTVRHQQLGY